ncbi:L-lactate dehydrogenase C chain [Habropoda laboriosa]|uniref:L-lactate dehydrogenase C chain n=1 Tax=Habropoda laboriosa TaxID=597456 RepID=A0A0L7QZQ0_9HYME|nr:L-lactate dehydrogenase C chain [Habropoda laboriosa]
MLLPSPAKSSSNFYPQGHHEICHETFLSLPCSIGENGVTNIVRMRITEFEKKLFQQSANVVYNVQKDVKTS